MEEAPPPVWPKRLAILFLVLFAIFWSLGAFFFWTLLSLTGYFTFLHFYISGSFGRMLSGWLTAFRGSPQPPPNPYRGFQPRPTSPAPSAVPVKKFIRFILVGIFSLFFFLFLIGVFFGEDETPAEETVSYSEPPEEDNGTTYWNERGNAALQNDLSDSAIYYYDQALAIDPQNVYALYNKGLAYVLRQDYRRGNALARRCVAHHPEYDPAWWLLGYSYDLTNYTDSALYCLEQAYGHEYSQPDFLQLLAEVYVKKDKRRNALEVYQRMVSLDTTRADIFRKMSELDPANAATYDRKIKALEN